MYLYCILMTRYELPDIDRRTFVKTTGAGAIGMGGLSTSSTADEGAQTTSEDDSNGGITPPPGPVVPVGGGFEPENEALYVELLELVGNEPTVAIVPTANSDPERSIEVMSIDFLEYGEQLYGEGAVTIEEVEVAPAGPDEWAGNEDDPDVAAQIENADLVWFSGGNQLRITETFFDEDGEEVAVATAIREHVENGGAVAGSSAGAAIMTDPMIGAGQSTGSLLDGVSYEDTYYDDDDNRVYLTRGLGYLGHGIADQHFYERGRFGRLLRALWHEGEDLGYGVGENTGLIFEADEPRARVSGENGVMVIDLSEAQAVENDSEALELEDVRVHHLSDGDVFDYDSRTVDPNDTDKFDVTDNPFYTTNQDSWDVFGSPQAVKDLVTEELAVNEQETVRGTAISVESTGEYERRTEVRLLFSQDERTEGWEGEYEVQEMDWRYTAIDVHLDVEIGTFALIDDHIDTETLRDVISAWQTGEPLS